MSNRQRFLADLLSIDAWHDPFRIDGVTSAVHVELSFHGGRLGADNPEMPFTFRINLRRALLTLRLEEPLRLKRSSVARNVPLDTAELTRILAAKEEVKRNRKLDGSISLKSFTSALSGGLAEEQQDSREQKVKVVQQVPRMMVAARPRGSQECAWELQPTYEDFLEGQPWDPVLEPRLKALHPSQYSRIEPTIKAQVTCALEDISIRELERKPVGLVESIKQTIKNDVSYSAAVQYLKQTLIASDLDVARVDGRFSNLVLADVISQEEVD